MHGRIWQAKIDNRTKFDEEAAVRRAAARRQLRALSCFLFNCSNDYVVELAGRGKERLTRDARLDPGSGSLALGDLLDQFNERGSALKVVEADVELCRGTSRNDVARVCWRRDSREFEV